MSPTDAAKFEAFRPWLRELQPPPAKWMIDQSWQPPKTTYED